MRSSDNEYIKILEQNIQKIDEDIRMLQIRKSYKDSKRIDYKIADLEEEKRILQNQINRIKDEDSRASVSRSSDQMHNLDLKHDDISEDYGLLKEQIETYKKMREELISSREKRRATRNITKMERQLEKMANKASKIEGKQRRILLSKYKVEQKRNQKIARARARSEEYKARAEDLARLHEKGLVSDAKFESKTNRYMQNHERKEELLAKLKNKGTKKSIIRGSRKLYDYSKEEMRDMLEEKETVEEKEEFIVEK